MAGLKISKQDRTKTTPLATLSTPPLATLTAPAIYPIIQDAQACGPSSGDYHGAPGPALLLLLLLLLLMLLALQYQFGRVWW